MPSDRRTRVVRFLRIAVSAVCLIFCVLLIALWVRSHGWLEGLNGPISEARVLILGSSNGNVTIRAADDPRLFAAFGRDWAYARGATFSFSSGETDGGYFGTFRMLEDGMVLPHWFPILTFATLAALPWLPFRFSLRTLLIATTFIAVVLGLVVWAAR